MAATEPLLNTNSIPTDLFVTHLKKEEEAARLNKKSVSTTQEKGRLNVYSQVAFSLRHCLQKQGQTISEKQIDNCSKKTWV